MCISKKPMGFFEIHAMPGFQFENYSGKCFIGISFYIKDLSRFA